MISKYVPINYYVLYIGMLKSYIELKYFYFRMV